MTLDVLASLLFVLGLALVGVLAWTRQATTLRFCLIAIVVWGLGVFAANSAFYHRGSVWLKEPMRRFSYELKSQRGHSLGKHHLILAPTEVERLPALYDAQNKPVALTVDFTLQPDGRVTQPRTVRSSGNPILDSATTSLMAGWKFGPLPSGYTPRRAETVRVVIENRHEFLRQSRTLLASLGFFVAGWLATVLLLPRVVSDDTHAQGIVRRALTVAGFLAGVGWILIWRLAPDFNRFDLPAKQLGMMVLSFALVWGAAIVVARPTFSRLLALHSTKFVGLGVLLLLVTRFFGTDLNTGHRLWLSTPFGPFQTVEFVKLLLLFFVAGTAYVASHAESVGEQGSAHVARLRPWRERYRGMIGGFVLVFGALVLMGDFGPLLLLALLLMALVLAQGFPRQATIGLVALLALLTVSYLVHVPARWHDRVEMWSHPWVATSRDSAQLAEGRENVARMLWSVSSGGVAGTGLGQGNPDDVEAVESDFIFAAISEELGWLGGAAMLSLLLVLAVTGFQLARLRDDALAKTLACGLGAVIAIQAALTIGGNLGAWPLTGITLPFLSYGRSSLLISFLALGLLVGLAPKAKFANREQPFPLASRVVVSMYRLQVGTCVLFVLLAIQAARLQWPKLRTSTLTQTYKRPDLTTVANPRLDAQNRLVSTHVVRGSILDQYGNVLVKTTPRGRYYADASVFSSLVGLQQKGQRVGLERALQGPLMGSWDAPGANFRWPKLESERQGFNVRLTLDSDLQKRAYELLESHNYRGCLVGIEPATGKILFAASRPSPSGVAEWIASYDDNAASAPPSVYRTWYEPGSTFKTLTSAAALDTGAVQPDERFRCVDGYFPRGGGEINDYLHAQHGNISLSRAMAVSCNQTFAQVGVRLGWDRFWDYSTQAGINTAWPLLPAQWRVKGSRSWLEMQPGQLTQRHQKPKNRYDDAGLARSAIGQENVRVTPLYLAMWTAAIANGGKLMPPSLVTSVSDAAGRIVATAPTVQAVQVMRPSTAQELTGMMERVVNDARGTGKPARVEGIRVAAKTGTPQLGRRDKGNNALFIAFAPVEKPRIAIAVVIENQSGGGATGGPLAADMIRAVYR